MKPLVESLKSKNNIKGKEYSIDFKQVNSKGHLLLPPKVIGQLKLGDVILSARGGIHPYVKVFNGGYIKKDKNYKTLIKLVYYNEEDGLVNITLDTSVFSPEIVSWVKS